MEKNFDLTTKIQNAQKEHTRMSALPLKTNRRRGVEGVTPSESIHEINPTTADSEVSAVAASALDPIVSASLRVVHLRKVFNHDFVAVHNSSFITQNGELLAIIGANGSGKSTTCHMLCGVIPPTAGDVFMNDRLSLFGSQQRHELIGWCPQHDILFDQLTPVEHVQSCHVKLMIDCVICCYSRCAE